MPLSDIVTPLKTRFTNRIMISIMMIKFVTRPHLDHCNLDHNDQAAYIQIAETISVHRHNLLRIIPAGVFCNVFLL